jgi:hypothetical protein
MALLREQAKPYQELDPCTPIVLVFHAVVTVADDHPGEDGNYSHRMTDEAMRKLIDDASAEGAWVILDIQAAQSPITDELKFVEPYLREPNVHLAVDPEWTNPEGGIPMVDRGWMDGETINLVQAWLNEVAEQTGENKILVVHQFDDSFVQNKHLIQNYPMVDMIWDADGYGGPEAKAADYHQYRDEAGFEYGGFKVFYKEDNPVMTPGQVMALDPPPAYIIYQ